MTPTEGDDDGPRSEVEEDGPRSVSLSDSCLSLRLHSKDKQDRAHHLFSISIWDMDSLQHPKNSDLSGGKALLPTSNTRVGGRCQSIFFLITHVSKSFSRVFTLGTLSS